MVQLITPNEQNSSGGIALPAGGKAGDFLVKTGDGPNDFEWRNISPEANKLYYNSKGSGAVFTSYPPTERTILLPQTRINDASVDYRLFMQVEAIEAADDLMIHLSTTTKFSSKLWIDSTGSWTENTMFRLREFDNETGEMLASAATMVNLRGQVVPLLFENVYLVNREIPQRNIRTELSVKTQHEWEVVISVFTEPGDYLSFVNTYLPGVPMEDNRYLHAAIDELFLAVKELQTGGEE